MNAKLSSGGCLSRLGLRVAGIQFFTNADEAFHLCPMIPQKVQESAIHSPIRVFHTSAQNLLGRLLSVVDDRHLSLPSFPGFAVGQ